MTIRKMINTKTGMVSVFDQLVLNERDWYKEFFDENNSTPSEAIESDESVQSEEKKRRSLKQALQDKAEKLQALDTVALEQTAKAE